MIVFKGGSLGASGSRTGLGKGFGGLTSYLQRGAKAAPQPDRVAWVAYRNLAGVDDPRHAAQVMRAHANENDRVRQPVYHLGFSLNPGEHLSRESWEKAIDQVLHRMGLATHQAVLVAHRDTEKEHVHLIVNRVGPNGRAWDLHDDMVKAREAIRRIERDLGLIPTGGRDLPVPDLTPGTYHEARRTGVQPIADRLRDQARDLFGAATSWHDLEARLAREGFRLEPAARGSGLVVTDGSRAVSLSRVDRSLSGPKLAERFGSTFRDHRLQEPEPPTPAAVHRSVVPLPGETLEARAAALVGRLTETRATFTETDLRRAAFHHPESVALVREALRSNDVLELGRDARGAHRYTTREYLEAEVRLLVTATKLASRDRLRLEPEGAIEAIRRAAPVLSPEQRRAVFHATAQTDLAQIVGRAGAGKTTAARTIAAAYREQGYALRGAALSGKAAEVLERETAISSRTIASLELAWSEGREPLHARSVLVVDESGMIDARTLGRLLAHAEDRGAKVVLLGDPNQLQAIGAGDAYRGLLEQHASAHIGTIRRQAEPWQRVASEDLAFGRVASALDRYDTAGRLHWAETPAAAQAALLDRYERDRREAPNASQLILAYRRDDVAQLNEGVRVARKAAGEIQAGVQVGRIEVSAGDRIVFLRNEPGREVATVATAAAGSSAGVRNGTLGTVLTAEAHRITVRLDEGREVSFDPSRYPSIAHGYAVTVHKAQGATIDQVYTLADPIMNRHAAYVALTRHREGVHLFADRESFPSRAQLDRTLSRDGRKDLASDYSSADLRRAVSRYQEIASKILHATREERPLREALAAHERLRETRQHVIDSRRSLFDAASRVYLDPAKAFRGLVRDPAALDNLRRAQPAVYGALRGRGSLLGVGKERGAAPAVAALTGRLEAYRRSLAGLEGAKRDARELGARLPLTNPSKGIPGRTLVQGAAAIAVSRRPGRAATGQVLRRLHPTTAQVHRQLNRVTNALRAYRFASQSAQDAIEVAIRGMGRVGLNSALLLLPPEVAIPVGIAARAVERVLSKAMELGLER